MATIVDELIVKLGLDVTGIQRGHVAASDTLRTIRDAFKRYGEDIQRSSGAVNTALATIRLGYVALAAVAVDTLARIEKFAVQTAAANIGIGRHAELVGMTTRQYDQLRRTLEDFAPGGGQAFENTMQGMGAQLMQAQISNTIPPLLLQFANASGVSLVDAKGNWRSLKEIIQDAADFTKRQHMTMQEAARWGEGFGIDPIVMQRYRLSAADRKRIEDFEQQNALTDAQEKASQRLWMSWSMLGSAIGRVGNVLLEKLEKPMTRILDVVTKIIEAFADFVDTANFDNLEKVFDGFFETLHKVANFLNSLHAALHALALAIRETFAVGNLGPLGAWLDKLLGPGFAPEEAPGSGAPSRGGDGGGGGGRSTGAAAPTSATPPLSQSKTAIAGGIASAFRKAGLPETAVAGILGNVQQESNFNPSSREADQPNWGGEAHFAHGLYQEGGEEWNRYVGWLQANHPGGDWRDPDLQTQFLIWNLQKNYPGTWKRLQNATSPQQGAMIFRREYLKPAEWAANDPGRIANANRFYANPPKAPSEGLSETDVADSLLRGNQPLVNSVQKMQDASKPNLRNPPAPAAGAGLSASQYDDRWGGPTSTTNTNTNTVNIGVQNIHTQADDVVGIAKDLGPAIQNHSFANQANTGPQ